MPAPRLWPIWKSGSASPCDDAYSSDIAEHHVQALAPFRGREEVAETRQTGTIAAIELRVPDAGYLAALGPKLNAFYLEHDVLLRTLGNVVYVLAPYCVGASELDRIYGTIDDSLALVAV